MPFITYKINENYFTNYKQIKNEDLIKFNNDIEDFNYNEKAIHIKNSDLDVFEQLGNLIKKLSSETLDISLTQKKILLENILRTLNQSIDCNSKFPIEKNIHIDFEKNLDNQIDKNYKIKIIEGNFYPEDYGSLTKEFVNKFLGKLEVYINSKFKGDKVNAIYIYHKELSSYLMPIETLNMQSLEEFQNKLDPNINKEKFQLINMRKIKYGINLLFNWWKELPDNIRPQEFKVLTDVPNSIGIKQRKNITDQEISMLETKIDHFFSFSFFKKGKASIKIVRQYDMPGSQGWKHKRHWILGKKLKKNNNKQVNFYAIKSDFGVEIVDPLNKDKLNKEMELTIITNKNIKQMRDISEYLMQDTKSK